MFRQFWIGVTNLRIEFILAKTWILLFNLKLWILYSFHPWLFYGLFVKAVGCSEKKECCECWASAQQLLPYSFLHDDEHTSNNAQRIILCYMVCKMQSRPAPGLRRTKTTQNSSLPLICWFSGILDPIAHLSKATADALTIMLFDLISCQIGCEMRKHVSVKK